MEGGKEDSTTDNFPSLVFLSARLVYYINLNCMYNLEKTVVDTYYCKCLEYFLVVENPTVLWTIAIFAPSI